MRSTDAFVMISACLSGCMTSGVLRASKQATVDCGCGTAVSSVCGEAPPRGLRVAMRNRVWTWKRWASRSVLGMRMRLPSLSCAVSPFLAEGVRLPQLGRCARSPARILAAGMFGIWSWWSKIRRDVKDCRGKRYGVTGRRRKMERCGGKESQAEAGAALVRDDDYGAKMQCAALACLACVAISKAHKLQR